MSKQTQPINWTDDQLACIEALSVFALGRHHCNNLKPYGSGVCMTWFRGEVSTYDADYLTRLVLTGHALAVRMSVEPSGPGMLKISAFKRQHSDDNKLRIWERHPSLEDLRDLVNLWIQEQSNNHE